MMSGDDDGKSEEANPLVTKLRVQSSNSKPKVKSSHVTSRQVRPSQVKSSQVKSSQVKSQVQSNQVKSSQAKSSPQICVSLFAPRLVMASWSHMVTWSSHCKLLMGEAEWAAPATTLC